MNKKFLSVLLAFAMVISSINCLFTMAISAEETEPENLMVNTQPSDWISGIDGAEGSTVDGEIQVSAAWRSVYTKVKLVPNSEYTLSFNFAQVRVSDVRVFPASEITDTATQLRSPDEGGECPGGTTNLASGALTTELASGAPVDGKFYAASEIFNTTNEEEYYIILDCKEPVTTASVVLRDLSLALTIVEEVTPNTEIANPANWASTGTYVSFVSAEGKDGTAGVATTVDPLWRDTYAKVTLEPNTDYTLSFSYKGTTKIGSLLVLAVSDSAYEIGDDHVCVRKEGATPCVQISAGGYAYSADMWTDIAVSFTTKEDTEYYLIFDHDGTEGGFTVSNFNFKKPTAIINPKNWSSTWRLQGSPVNITPSTESKDGGDGINVDLSTWRDTFATVVLDANNEYTLSFNYKGVSTLNSVAVFDKADIDLETYKTANGSYPDHIPAALKSGASALCDYYTANLGTYDGNNWVNITLKFNTTENSEYYIVLNHGANNGFTISDLTLEKTIADKDNVLDNSVASDWNTSWRGQSVTTTSSGLISVPAAWRSAYTKVTLEPNTKYDFKFSHGEVKVNNIRVFAASEITDPATQLVSDDNGGDAPGGTNNLATANVATNCNGTPVVGEFYTTSESFTTGSETEYYIFLDCGAFSTASTSIILKDLSLKKYVPNANVDVVNPANWSSTWILGGAAVNIANTTDSYRGGEAISVAMSHYRDTFVKLILTANTKYEFSFNYKGEAAMSNLHLIALNDIDEAKYSAKPEHLINTLKEGASTTFTQGFAELTYDGTTWNEVSVEFETNENTEYYLVFENNGGGLPFVASDFEFVVSMDVDDLTDTVASDWISTWNGEPGTNVTHNVAFSAAWRSVYTKVTLEANRIYDFSFMGSNVKVSNIRVYAASEITNVETQLRHVDDIVQGGTNNLVTSFASSAPEEDFGTADSKIVASYYDYSATFTTGADTEYYIIIDSSQFNAMSGTNLYLKDLSLVAQPLPEKVAGDILGDGDVDLEDVTALSQYLAGWNNEVDTEALDVNGDGAVNLKDLVLLAQFVAGWDVTLN